MKNKELRIMAYYYPEASHTFGEYLLVPGYSDHTHVPTAVSLKTPLVFWDEAGSQGLSPQTPLIH